MLSHFFSWPGLGILSVTFLCLATLVYFYATRIDTSLMLHGNVASRVCAGKNFSERYNCWNTILSQEIAEDRIIDALDQLSFFSKESPDFISVCHTLAHRVGEQAYKDFKAGKTMQSSLAMQVCDFGFYHGFMTEFLTESRNYTEVGNFCAAMQIGEYDGEKSSSREACFHGIGHGSVISHDPEDWKNPLVILRQALVVCHSAAQNQKDFLKCAGGAYNGMAYGPYEKQINPTDPFNICREVTKEDSPVDCYANLASTVFNRTPDKDIREAIDLARPYTPSEYLVRIIPTFANMAARQEDSMQRSVKTCLGLYRDQRAACLGGFVSGLVQSGVPEAKEKRAYSFCASDVLPDEERVSCFTTAFDVLTNFWSEQKIKESCLLIPSNSAKACNTAFTAWRAVQREIK